ncbi:hypothetical protein ACYATO_08765 [Lactobacillaceae bacterium Melli_B3]
MDYEKMVGVMRYTHGIHADNKLYATAQTFKHYYLLSDSGAYRAINELASVKKIKKKLFGTGKVITINAIPIGDFIMDYALYKIDQEKPDTEDIEAEHDKYVNKLKGTFDTKKIPVKLLLSRLVDEHFETIKLIDELDGLKRSIAVQKLQEFKNHDPQFVKGPAYNEYNQWLQDTGRTEPEGDEIAKRIKEAKLNQAKQSKPNSN